MSSLSSVSSANSRLGNTGTLTIGGLATGLNVDQIITGLMSIDQRRIDNLNANKTKVQGQQTAFKGIQARLLALQGNLGQLARAQNGVFDLRSVSSSDDSLVSAAASASATPGIYQVTVNSLAQSHQIASEGFDSANAAITQGTFQIGLGSSPGATITIDSSNNTLQGLANAINGAGVGVAATVVQDGSGSQPYRLLLTATKSGTSNAISISNNLAADNNGATRPVFDQSYVGAATTDAAYTGTATPTANTGAGGFTGTSNNTYTFTVLNGGTVGVDNNLQIGYRDVSGAHTGTLTLNAGDVDAFKTVAEGIQVKLGAGTLVAGQTFTVRGFVPQVQAAQNASVSLGSGAGALTVQSATNQIDNLFPGISLSLKGANPSRAITLTVANNVDSAATNIKDFVDGFNGLMDYIDQQVQFDSQSNTAGPLLGNIQVTSIQDQVRRTLLGSVTGLNSKMNRLGAIGITLDDNGHLQLDQGKLNDALSGNIAGVSLDDVRRLFSLSATSSDPGIEFVTGGAQTKTGSTVQTVITQAAEQASIQATSALAASTTIDGTNNTVTLNVDGANGVTLHLRQGTYSRLALEQELQAQIDASSLAGRGAQVSLNGNNLVVTSGSYGANSRVSLGGGTGLSALGFAGTESDSGQDVAGHFLVNGQIEAAAGAGQLLLGSKGNANTADLEVRVHLTAAQVGAGSTSDLTVTRGVASAADALLTNLLDPVNGRLKTVDDSYQSNLDDIQKTVNFQTALMAQQKDALMQKFANLETTVSQLQGIGNFLTQQFASLNGISTGRK